MQEIMPGIFVESDYAACNLGLIKMDEGFLALNMPLHPTQAQAWLAQAEALVGEIRYVVLLDARLENVILTAALGKPIIATETLLRQIQEYDERGWRELLQTMETHYPDDTDIISRLKPRSPTLAFNAEFRFYQRKKRFNFEVVPGVAPGSLWLFIPEQGVLFTGDSVTIDEPPPMRLAPDLQAWFQALLNLNRRTEVRHIIPGRGRSPVARWEIEQQIEFMRTAQQTAMKLTKGYGRGESVGLRQAAEDLGQVFYNSAGAQAVQRIKVALQKMM